MSYYVPTIIEDTPQGRISRDLFSSLLKDNIVFLGTPINDEVANESENRIQDMALRLQAQGLSLEQFFQFSGQSPDDFMATIKQQADQSARMDLALRAIAKQEGLEVSEEEVDEELANAADQYDRTPEELKAQFIESGNLAALKADLLKSKTVDWLTERAKVVDEDGQLVPADALELPEDESEEDDE